MVAREGMKENEVGYQRAHDVKKMAYLLEQLSRDTDIGTIGSNTRSCTVSDSSSGRSSRSNPAATTPSKRVIPRQNSFVRFKESSHGDLFVTKSHDSYFEERAARLNKRVSFNFEVQSDDGQVWSPSRVGGGLNDFQRADVTLKRIEKRSRVSKSFKPMQSFDETIEQISLHNQQPAAPKPFKRKISFASFVKNVQKERTKCTADLNSKDGKQSPAVVTKNRRNSFVNFIQNRKLSSSRPAPSFKNRVAICRDSEGEDSVSSFTTMKKSCLKSEQNSLNRPAPLILPRRRSPRPSVTELFSRTSPSRHSSSSSSTHTVTLRNTNSFSRSDNSFSRSDSGYSSTTTCSRHQPESGYSSVSSQSLPAPRTDNQLPSSGTNQPPSSGTNQLPSSGTNQLPSSGTNRRPSISQTTATFKRQLSLIPSNPIFEDFPDPLESVNSNDKEQSCHHPEKSPKLPSKLKRKESKRAMFTRTISQNILGHISWKPAKSPTRSAGHPTRFIGVNKYKAFETLVSR